MRYLAVSKDFTPYFSSAGKFESPGEHIHPRRRLKSAVILAGYIGKCPIAQNERKYILSAGDIMLLFPEQEHYGTDKTDSNQSHFWCHFYLPPNFKIIDDTQLNQALQSGFVFPEFLHISNFEKFCVLFPQLIDASEARYINKESRTAVCSGYIKIILAELCEEFLRKKSEEPHKNNSTATVSKVCEWIRLNSSTNISVSSVATAFGYNPTYLSNLLKRETGFGICAFINQMRIRESKKLLLNSSMRISEIAYAVGFSDEKYFMKVFRKEVGITASEYRKAHFRQHGNKS